MSSRLPDRIDPVRLAQRGARLVGELPLARMTRLAEVLAQTDSVVKVELCFALSRQGWTEVTGSLSAHVYQTCQRCLEPVQVGLDKTLNLAVVETEAELGKLPDDKDPLLCGDEPLSVIDLVEDELLLLLPQEPKHTMGTCAGRHSWHSGEPPLESGAAMEANPFAVLERLKKRD